MAGWRESHPGLRCGRTGAAAGQETLAIMAVAAEPATEFPKAQFGSVPAVRVLLRAGAVLTAAGVPVLLAALP
jgi:hypothetical protein